MFSSSRITVNNNSNTVIDPYFKNTIFLLHADGTNGANNTTYVDSSNYAGTISRGALLNSQGSFSPYSPAGWSMYLNGTTDYLTFTAAKAGTIGTGDFTVELWTWINSAPALNSILFTIGSTNLTGSLSVFTTATNLYVRINYNQDTIITTLPSVNTWTHIAVVRISGVINVYYNGTAQNKSSSTGPGTTITNSDCVISYDNANAYWPAGYISNFRIVVGTGVYTGNFTPPTSQLATTQSAGAAGSNIAAVSSGTAVLLNLNRWYDASGNDYQITVFGASYIAPFSPFAASGTYTPSLHGGSIYHASATDWVGTTTAVVATALSWPQLGLGGEDFGIEFWAYPLTNTNTTQYFFSNYSADTNQRGMRIGVSGSTGVAALFGTGAVSVPNNITRPIYGNSWTHVAVTRRNSVLKVFQNGQIVATVADGNVYNLPTFTIGSASYARTSAVIGYTSDLRMTRGASPYFDNSFTPPAAALGLYAADSNYRTVCAATNNTSITFTPSITTLSTVTGFCLEFWFNVSIMPAGATVELYGGLVNALTINVSTGAGVQIGNSGYYNIPTTLYGLAPNIWYHLAVIGYGGVNYVALNGVVYNTNRQGGGSASSESGVWNFGAAGFNISGGYGTCYIRDYRLTTGSAVYNLSGFTPPTSTPGITVSGGSVKALLFTDNGITDLTGNGSVVDPTYLTVGSNLGGRGSTMYNTYSNVNDTILLLNGSNGSLIDATGRNVITYGAAGGATIPSISTSNRKFGTGGVGAMAAGFMRIPNSPLWDFGSGDWIIEFWFYPTNVTTLQTIYSKKAAAANFGPVQTNVSTTGKMTTLLSTSGSATTQTLTAVASVAITTWNYVAIYRSGVSVVQTTILANAFVDTQTNGTLSTTALAVNTADFTIGNQSNAASQPMLGYVDEFRVTKGTSRGYTTSSLPTLPTSAFPNQ
jgi:hypothetical protein